MCYWNANHVKDNLKDSGWVGRNSSGQDGLNYIPEAKDHGGQTLADAVQENCHQRSPTLKDRWPTDEWMTMMTAMKSCAGGRHNMPPPPASWPLTFWAWFSRFLVVQWTKTVTGTRAFAVAAVTVWNKLPADIRTSTCTVQTFAIAQKLKTFYASHCIWGLFISCGRN